MTTTRRFWSLSPSAPPLVTRAPRLEEGVTRRWFLGALGLVVAAPSVLVPADGAWVGPTRIDYLPIPTDDEILFGGARGGGKSSWVWYMHSQQYEAWAKRMRELAHPDKRKIRRLKRKGLYVPELRAARQAERDILFGGY